MAEEAELWVWPWLDFKGISAKPNNLSIPNKTYEKNYTPILRNKLEFLTLTAN